MLKKNVNDGCYKDAQTKSYGRGTVICNSWEEFDQAIKNVECGLVSPGGTGLSRSYVQELEKQGLIRVFRVLVKNADFENSLFLRFLYISRDEYIYIPVDDIDRVKTLQLT